MNRDRLRWVSSRVANPFSRVAKGLAKSGRIGSWHVDHAESDAKCNVAGHGLNAPPASDTLTARVDVVFLSHVGAFQKRNLFSEFCVERKGRIGKGWGRFPGVGGSICK